MQRIGTTWRQFDRGERFDAIVIGSGVGGLATAALLARHAARRVLVLERHYVAGGFTHVFERPGYEWDVGVHYVGEVHSERSLTRRLFDHLTGGRLQWAPMDDVYDRIVLGSEAYDLRSGEAAFREGLSRRFPAQAGAIDRYTALIREATRASQSYFAEKALPAALAAVAGPFLRRGFLRHARRSTLSVLQELTSDRQLIGVLTGQWGDYGLPPARSSFAMHAVLARHYLWGASYPVGGSSAIAAGIAPLVEQHGGRIVTGAAVAEVIVEGSAARGVRMADGTELRAPLVVSDAGVANTFQRLLPREAAERLGLREKLRPLRASLGHVCLYLGLDRTAAELQLPRTNLWIYPGPDHDATVAAALRDPEAPLPLAYVSFPSAKDPTFLERHPGKATIEVITLGSYERFARWQDGRWRRRGEDYDAIKASYAERLLSIVQGHVPSVRGHVAWSEVSTPLSTRHFANYAEGEIYGLEHTPERFEARFLRPRTPVPGLWLTGQDVVTCGVAGALASGVLTASAILGKNLLSAVGRPS